MKNKNLVFMALLLGVVLAVGFVSAGLFNKNVKESPRDLNAVTVSKNQCVNLDCEWVFQNREIQHLGSTWTQEIVTCNNPGEIVFEGSCSSSWNFVRDRGGYAFNENSWACTYEVVDASSNIYTSSFVDVGALCCKV